MKKRNRPALLRQIGAAAVSAAVLWVVFVSAGCPTLAAALSAMDAHSRRGLTLLQMQLGDGSGEGRLSAAAALVLCQSPLLLSSREAALSVQREAGEGAAAPAEDRESVREEPLIPDPVATPFADNGVSARTLIPASAEGYTVSGAAYISNASIHSLAPEELEGPFAAALSDGAPQVLIIHTHGSEAYTMPAGEDYVPSGECRTTDTGYNVVRIGDAVASVLAEYGISSVHDRSLYDYPNYSGAYDRSLAAIEDYLEQYPSITFVLDLHRDAIYDADNTPYKVLSSTEAGSAAQLTLVVGTDGSGLHHDRWRENLKLAAAVQNALLEEYPTLMRPIVVRNSRYNQHCTTGSLLVEVGAAGNSLEEALLAAELFARGFAETVLGGKSIPENG